MKPVVTADLKISTGSRRKMSGILGTLLCVIPAFVLSCSQPQPPDYLGSAVIDQRTVSLASSVGGTVVQVIRREGQLVTKDELCAVIDTVPHTLSLRETKAKLSELTQRIAAAGSKKEVLKTEMRGLAREYGRIGDLADKGAVPTREKENLGTKVQAADLEIEAAKHTLAALRSKKKAVEAEISRHDYQLNECYVRTPVSGRIVARYVNPGEISSPKSPILKIAVLDTVMIRFSVPNSRISTIRYDSPVYVRFETSEGTSTSVEASISTIENKSILSGPQNGAFGTGTSQSLVSVGAWIPNPKGILQPGLPVEVWLTPEPSR